MKVKQTENQERDRLLLEEFKEIFQQLSPWDQFLTLQYLRWLRIRGWIKQIPVNWIKFQLALEDDFRRLGMPRQLHWQLVKWFNKRAFPDVEDFYLYKGRKIWHYHFLEEDNFELHLRYKDQMPGNIWFQLKPDGTATVISIHVDEAFRNAGLGTSAFRESIRLLKDRVCLIKGVLEKEYYPKPENSLRWLRKEGFDVKQKENGDYEFEFRIKNR